MVILIQIIFA